MMWGVMAGRVLKGFKAWLKDFHQDPDTATARDMFEYLGACGYLRFNKIAREHQIFTMQDAAEDYLKYRFVPMMEGRIPPDAEVCTKDQYKKPLKQNEWWVKARNPAGAGKNEKG